MGNEDILAAIKAELQGRAKIGFDICEACGETNPLALKPFDEHHISTKAHDPLTTRSLCWNCHMVVTHKQNMISPHLRSRKLPLPQRILYILLTHTALRQRMEEVEERLIRQYYEALPSWTSLPSESTPDEKQSDNDAAMGSSNH